ncbi:MAG: aliphatic sulfonate ABC transporter substrate-binding protein [Clostridia bacterium]|nr:aliphatic sulfonate ABC transporter substrate-binding protein [Clostridia bacterium]
MKKVSKILSLFLAVLLIASALTACSSKEEEKKILVGVQEIPSADYLARTAGYIDEAFSALGYEVEFLTFSSGAKLNTALASGEIDFGYIGSCPVANAIASGIDIQAIYIHGIVGASESLVASEASGVNAVADLKGKVIATPFASTAHYSLLNALKANGIAEADVELLDMQPADIYAAWQRGDIDAAYVWEPTLSELTANGGKIILDSADVADLGYMTCEIEVVRTEFADEHPDLVKAYASALEKATQLYISNPEDAAEIVAKALEVSVEDAALQMSGYVWDTGEVQNTKYFSNGVLAQTLYDTASFLVEQGSVVSLPEKSVFDDACNNIGIAD